MSTEEAGRADVIDEGTERLSSIPDDVKRQVKELEAEVRKN